MVFKFCVNLSTTFTFIPFPERYKMAVRHGFQGVESQFIYNEDLSLLMAAKEESGLEQVLINSYPGDSVKKFGFALGSNEDFRSSMETTIRYCNGLNCKRLHVIGDILVPGMTVEEMESRYISNISCAADMCEQFDITVLIEPLCEEVKPNYFLSSYHKALAYVQHINKSNVKLLLDVYHLQRIHGNLTTEIKSLIFETGYVQISQVPNRDEPSAKGEIDYRYILALLHSLGYDGWIGLEYFPSEPDGRFQWIEQYGYKKKM